MRWIIAGVLVFVAITLGAHASPNGYLEGQRFRNMTQAERIQATRTRDEEHSSKPAPVTRAK